MRKLLLLPITLPLSMARGALEGALKATADALMDLAAGGGAAEADVYVPSTAAAAPPPAPTRPPTPAETELAAVERLVEELEDEDLEAEAPAADVVDLRVAPAPAATPHEVAVDLGLEDDHVDEEAELVETEGGGAPGAEIHVDEPWPGYGSLRAADVVDRLRAADVATKAVVRLYEQSHRNRRTVLAATES